MLEQHGLVRGSKSACPLVLTACLCVCVIVCAHATRRSCVENATNYIKHNSLENRNMHKFNYQLNQNIKRSARRGSTLLRKERNNNSRHCALITSHRGREYDSHNINYKILLHIVARMRMQFTVDGVLYALSYAVCNERTWCCYIVLYIRSFARSIFVEALIRIGIVVAHERHRLGSSVL